ncbi:hypothetical protein JDV02_000420 [Purpureocillium takamizusanense]|uniref:Rhodopsin domain-containing protein n=1 Tax=Purpureocillium takamizusanense TaxID=2060973 RepID=A0A9Q8V6D3_9HYPO|nr:uncharacterized protein JDV02_000420 [Purpureocillium takamizusanense]UNI13699.1 hypothetical protein JDV02_000420 [Purpureocillium takamizusanense]
MLTKNLTETACDRPVRDSSGTLIALNNTLGIITGLFVLQRFAFKIFSRLSIHLDDWFTLLTTLVGVPATVINRYGLPPNGIGRDVWTLTEQQITSFGRFFYAMEVIYFTQVALLKLALLFFYIRIFSGAAESVRALLWGTTVLTVGFGIAFVVAAVFQCDPVSFFWTRWDDEQGQGRCMSINAIAWSNAAISIALDVWMLALPISQLKQLDLSWRKKTGAGIMFCTGAFVTVVSILRLKLLVDFGSDSINPTWDNFQITCWSTVEMNVGIICVCLPSLRLMIIRTFPRVLNTVYGANSRQVRNTSHDCKGNKEICEEGESHGHRVQHDKDKVQRMTIDEPTSKASHV